MEKLKPEFAYWKGIPREEIIWHPIIDENKCTGCGMCITSCGRNVFDYDWKERKAVVARPLQCMVGCTSCQVWCVFNAISFPDSQYVKDLIIKRKVLTLAKRQLEERRRQLEEIKKQ
ncbi:MAG: 4Fe-4S binding protein [Thermotogaceae bacterium]|nr:4Fe-4S binding protein [Thermotogaceae bacterium]